MAVAFFLCAKYIHVQSCKHISNYSVMKYMVRTSEKDDPIWKEMGETGKLGPWTVQYHESIDSTNSAAMELARDNSNTIDIVVADSQQQGRGRHKRSWHSPKGDGLYFSVITRPQLPVKDFPKLTLVTGVACCRALEQLTAQRPTLKWPNDILYNGKKCGGILCEAGGINTDAPYAVIGIGLNVSTPQEAFPAELSDKATSLISATGQNIARGGILQAVCRSLTIAIKRLENGEFLSLLDEWRSYDAYRDKEVSWLTDSGEVVTGISLGPDQEGQLHIRTGNGVVHTVISGDITLKIP